MESCNVSDIYLVLVTMEARVGRPHVATAPFSVLLNAEEGGDLRTGDNSGTLSVVSKKVSLSRISPFSAHLIIIWAFDNYLVNCFNHFLGLWKTTLVPGGSMGSGSFASRDFVTLE